MRELWRRADAFRERLKAIKRTTPLEGATWYPYDSLAPMEVLDQFLGGDPEALKKMIGNDPALDLGCGDGDTSFFLTSLGASVEAIDHAATNYNGMRGVATMKQALNVAGVKICPADLDRPLELASSRYGFALLMGILYHLKNPYMILEVLAHKAHYCFLSTRIAALAGDRKTKIAHVPVAYLLAEGEANQDDTNFWIFSEAGLRRIVERAGWRVLHFHATANAASSDPVSAKGDARAYCLLESRLELAPAGVRLLEGWHALEFGAWRWTERRFSIAIDGNAAGRTLRLRFYLAPVVFGSRSSVTLRANGVEKIYTSPGEQVFDCPAASRVDFELDSAIAPTETDRRELGVQVQFVEANPITLA